MLCFVTNLPEHAYVVSPSRGNTTLSSNRDEAISTIFNALTKGDTGMSILPNVDLFDFGFILLTLPKPNEHPRVVAMGGLRYPDLKTEITTEKGVSIKSFCVEKTLRRTGIGQMLVHHLEQLAQHTIRNTKATSFVLHFTASNDEARQFWEAAGFIPYAKGSRTMSKIMTC